MQASDQTQPGGSAKERRERYQQGVLGIRAAFEAGAAGVATIAARAALVDELVGEIWLGAGGPAAVALVAVGGYGRRELFPFSDVDLLFLLEAKTAEGKVKEAIRRVNQELWDLGLRIAPVTRRLAECGRFDAAVPEFTLALLDHRLVAGNAGLYERLAGETVVRLVEKDGKAILGSLVGLTRERHAKYGGTLFHLEPNIKDCPGGLRDVHVCGWVAALRGGSVPVRGGSEEFHEAVEFLFRLRCFLHYKHERDDNTLDWGAQDEAAAAGVGLARRAGETADAAYWMRIYFRHARSIERRLGQVLQAVPEPVGRMVRLRSSLKLGRVPVRHGYSVERGRLKLDEAAGSADPAHDPEAVLQALVEMAEGGATLDTESEERLSRALPLLSSQMEEGATLWIRLRAILSGSNAAQTLRTMHAIGLLELLIPEFHGIDALVIRDAYHRYTVDEHTFVLIETLHGLTGAGPGAMAEWAAKFAGMLRDMAHPELLYLAALLHDTGKGRSSGRHAVESVRLAAGVVARLELDAYEAGLVLGLIANHLEMSATLRRDIFDTETVRAFAGKVGTPEALRMLTLFTYADINAVHPDALTPWKAENLWRLHMATSNFLDRSVDEERVSGRAESELVYRVTAGLAVGERLAVEAFLEGFPERYLRTRTPEQVRTHFAMTRRFAEDPVQLEFRHAATVSEITLVTPDGPLLFANLAGALAAWGMNIVTADAFSNRGGTVVDTLRFTDNFRTLEMNASEHGRFVASVREVVSGRVALDTLLRGRRKARAAAPRVRVEPRVEFDREASAHSTLLQVVAQDVPGLLRALSLAIGAAGCNIEVALVDTEGEMAIDVFYLTREGRKLRPGEEEELRGALGEVAARGSSLI